MKKITLGVTSSVSIYKACEILRRFQDQGLEVQVIMTRNATKLIAPQLFRALSGYPVLVDLFSSEEGQKIGHISLAEETALLVVAPATANIIGKFASGVADDFLSTFFLAVRCPVLIAPAMNEAMYLHPQTQANIQRLRTLGVEFVLPDKGYLACRSEGWGRLASPEEIVERGRILLEKTESLRGQKVIVTAGPTRERLDPVRFLSNRSSGKMGYALAAEALRRGAEVVLISGPTALTPPARATLVPVETASEMAREVERHLPSADILMMAAAVSDFRFETMFPEKIRKDMLPSQVTLLKTEDILADVCRKKAKKKLVVVGFAAETHDVRRNALLKLRAKNLDLIVANDVSQPGIGFESDFNRVLMVDRKGNAVETETLSKREISRLILDKVEGLLGKKKR
ncbi:MAG: bifunctional phosphopantothenoylcysteine decarboxylase/phosphopantothenate--cysteine ligase CoaBC [Candidatus Aminicenantales bacterium]